ncbi:MAG: TadE/TadG family type IV pilus assembly protein [Gemmataceae bacterium]
MPQRKLLTRSRRRGAAAVEFAFNATVLFMIIFGMIEIGRGIMVRHLLNNAARVGARAGIIEGTSTSQIVTTVRNQLIGYGIADNVQVTVLVNGQSGDASNAQAGDTITVVAAVPANSTTLLPSSLNIIPRITGNQSERFTLNRE